MQGITVLSLPNCLFSGDVSESERLKILEKVWLLYECELSLF